MNIYKEIKGLEKKGVFIHFGHEHPSYGSHCLFSIEITEKGKHKYQTSWYGDNKEFGDTADTMVSAIKIARLFAKNNNAKKYFNDVKRTTEQRRNEFRKIWSFRTEFNKKIIRFYKKNSK